MRSDDRIIDSWARMVHVASETLYLDTAGSRVHQQLRDAHAQPGRDGASGHRGPAPDAPRAGRGAAGRARGARAAGLRRGRAAPRRARPCELLVRARLPDRADRRPARAGPDDPADPRVDRSSRSSSTASSATSATTRARASSRPTCSAPTATARTCSTSCGTRRGPKQLASYGFDDDGRPATREHIIQRRHPAAASRRRHLPGARGHRAASRRVARAAGTVRRSTAWPT